MTQSEFIKMYCDNSGTTEDRLNELGLFAVPCDCDSEECEGFAMLGKKHLKFHCDLYIKHC